MNDADVLRDEVFAEHVGFRPLTLDLYLPREADRPAPIIVFVHGGGFRLGTRKSFSPGMTQEESFGRLIAAGFAVAAIDYRLSGEAVYPAQTDDIESALSWVEAHAAEHGIDPSRIVLWGLSAGGTLAALAGLTHSPKVRGVIDWYGLHDLIDMAEFSKTFEAPGESREDRWIGGSVFDLLETAAEASPTRRVHAGAPPFHIAHGAEDVNVPPTQSIDFAKALTEVGVEVELHLEPGAGHFWNGVLDVGPLFDRALAFAKRVATTTS